MSEPLSQSYIRDYEESWDNNREAHVEITNNTMTKTVKYLCFALAVSLATIIVQRVTHRYDDVAIATMPLFGPCQQGAICGFTTVRVKLSTVKGDAGIITNIYDTPIRIQIPQGPDKPEVEVLVSIVPVEHGDPRSPTGITCSDSTGVLWPARQNGLCYSEDRPSR